MGPWCRRCFNRSASVETWTRPLQRSSSHRVSKVSSFLAVGMTPEDPSDTAFRLSAGAASPGISGLDAGAGYRFDIGSVEEIVDQDSVHTVVGVVAGWGVNIGFDGDEGAAKNLRGVLAKLNGVTDSSVEPIMRSLAPDGFDGTNGSSGGTGMLGSSRAI